MGLVYGCASAHAPSLTHRTYRGWQHYYNLLSANVPQPPETAHEVEDVIEDYAQRSARAFGVMRHDLNAAEPDVILVVAGDQNEWFHATNLPNLLVYTGPSVSGFHNFGAYDDEKPLIPWENPDRFGVTLAVDQDFARSISLELIERGFDPCISREERPEGAPERGTPHAISRPLPLLRPERDIPIVPLMIKTVERSSATLSGRRCLELGKAIGEICARSSKRIAIYGSGGMSHDPFGPRSGWVDEPLDHWFLDCLNAGQPEKLSSLFSFQSAATISGTGELRTWMVVAAAMDVLQPGMKAETVDYFPARKVTAGCGWVRWRPESENLSLTGQPAISVPQDGERRR